MYKEPTKITEAMLQSALVYDIETLANTFTINVQGLFDDTDMTFVISEFENDGPLLAQWLALWEAEQRVMIGFNVLSFDICVLQWIRDNPGATAWDIYERAQDVIEAGRGGRGFHPLMIWQSDRFTPQIDMYLMFHFDNQAKRTSLKSLEVNMRSEEVEEMPLPHNVPISKEQCDTILIPYNKRDVRETKKFALASLEAIRFRIGLQETLRGDVLNWNDSKIGSKMLEQRLGRELTHDGKHMRQTIRTAIPIGEIIFPYVRFADAGFNGALDYLRSQTLRADEFDISGKVKTKGVFTKLKVPFNGIEWAFGTGGMHGSIYSTHVRSDSEWVIVDWDVAALYPSIAIVNGLFPEHLGYRFVEEYAKLPVERKFWQKEKGPKCVEANTIKLASNGTYGNSNSAYSVFYDPRFTMTITINGQLMLCMLGEMLATIPGLTMIQANTDGVTFRMRRRDLDKAERIKRAWEAVTKLVLEANEYTDMWIRDVGSYIARDTKGKLKLKGAFWYPVNFPEDVAQAQPPAWHKDLGNIVSQMAAVNQMVHGVPIEKTVNECDDPFLFMQRAKVDRSCHLYIGGQEVQRLTRYHVTRQGGEIRKIMPANGPVGQYKRKNGLTDREFYDIARTLPEGVHDERIHTKNKSVYEERNSVYPGTDGWLVTDVSKVSNFDWHNVNYDFHHAKAKDLVIA